MPIIPLRPGRQFGSVPFGFWRTRRRLEKSPYTTTIWYSRSGIFVSRITGPSLDLMGESIELLRYEGLIESNDAQNANPSLKITETGRASLQTLFEGKLRGRH